MVTSALRPYSDPHCRGTSLIRNRGGGDLGLETLLKSHLVRVVHRLQREIGILLPNNQRQHRTLHILEDDCLSHCASYCALCQPLLRAFSGWIRSPYPTHRLHPHPSPPELSVHRHGTRHCILHSNHFVTTPSSSNLAENETRQHGVWRAATSYVRLMNFCIAQL